jgi:vancomycin resistance protein YoaR
MDTGVSISQISAPQSIEETASDSALSSRLILVASRALLSVAALVLLAAAGLYAFRTSYADRVFPSIYVQGTNLGGISYPEATDALQASSESLLAAQVTFTYEGQRWSPTLEELGVSLDITRTLNSAFDVGRERDARDRVASTLDLVNGQRSIPLSLALDVAQFNAWLDKIDADLGQPARDAYLVVEDGKVTMVPDMDGLVVDRERARLLVVTGLETMRPFAGALPTIADAAKIHVTDLEPAKTQIETALSSSIKLMYGKDRWRLTPKDLGQFIVQTANPGVSGPDAVVVSVDRERLAAFLNSLLRDEVNRDPKNAVVAWDLKKQRVKAVENSAVGSRLKPVPLADAVIASLWGDSKSVEIPVAAVQPEVDSSKLDTLGITTKLAVGDSNFDGSDEGRSTNIAVGAYLLNGTLVPPQGEFSFNHSIGEITADLGYVESSVVDGERIGKDIGGGICQVSTTVFRAAFYAGLPITEWHPHRYRLGFYELDGWPPGLDASILQPEGDPFGGGDFKFSNPSDSWLLLESYVDGPRVYVIIYGPDLGYTVNVSEPWYNQESIPPTDDLELVDDELPEGTIQQTEYALSGMEIAYQRTVYDRDGNPLWDRTFATLFYPRGNVFKVSPDMQGLSPAS